MARLPLQAGLFRREAPGTDTHVSNTQARGGQTPKLRLTEEPGTHSGFQFEGKRTEAAPARFCFFLLFICLLCEVLMKCLSTQTLFVLNGGCLLMECAQTKTS